MRNYENIEHFVTKFKNGDYEYRGGNVFNTHTERILKGSIWGKGKYLCMETEYKGKRIRAYTHLIVFAYFNGIDELKKHETVDHINEDKHDNRIENLQGLSRFENSLKSCNPKFSKEEIISIREQSNNGISAMEIARVHSVSRYTIYDILKRRTYKHI